MYIPCLTITLEWFLCLCEALIESYSCWIHLIGRKSGPFEKKNQRVSNNRVRWMETMATTEWWCHEYLHSYKSLWRHDVLYHTKTAELFTHFIYKRRASRHPVKTCSFKKQTHTYEVQLLVKLSSSQLQWFIKVFAISNSARFHLIWTDGDSHSKCFQNYKKCRYANQKQFTFLKCLSKWICKNE